MEEIAPLLKRPASRDFANVFVTGPGGTGKTFACVKALLEHKKQFPSMQIAFTASTGIAALNMRRFDVDNSLVSTTIHSYSGIKIRDDPKLTGVVLKELNERCIENLKDVDIILIDEISMISHNVVDLLHNVLCAVRASSEHAFGGVQMIFSGDLKQLLPIKGQVFNNAKVLQDSASPLVTIELKIPHRFGGEQNPWSHLLDRMRLNQLTEDDKTLVNGRCKSVAYVEKWEKAKYNIPHIFTTKKMALAHNNKRLAELPGEHVQLTAIDEFEYSSAVKNLLACEAPEQISIKIGALVMVTQNIDLDGGIVNGTMGYVTDIKKSAVYIKSTEEGRNNVVTISRALYSVTYKKTVYSRYQFPIQLGYGFTVHKVQGCEFRRVVLHVTKNCFFCHGQMYTMFSRAKELGNIFIIGAGI